MFGLDDKAKEEKEAAKKKAAEKQKALRPNERVIAELEDGYLFVKDQDGIVRYRSDEQHEIEHSADKFKEPTGRAMKPTALG